MTLKCFYTNEPPKNSRFVAIYADGGGAALFRLDNAGNYCDVNGDLVPDGDWFADAGFLNYILLPDNFRLWFEGQEK